MPSRTSDKLLAEIAALDVGNVKLMEVCGTHTMVIAKSGLKTVLPGNIKLLSGPGCPVCVTPPEVIDAVLDLAMRPGVIVTTYGDMVRVPGSVRGDSLAKRRAMGAKVEIVYSPMDAIETAKRNPDKEIVFLGVGFETTAPGTAAAVLAAKADGVKNFSVWSMLKTVEPALRALIAEEDFDIQGFICPGHVAAILGEKGFAFLADEYKIPAVIAPFEPEGILMSVYRLVKPIADGTPRLENEYKRVVRPEGNLLAEKMLDEAFELRTDIWRGLGKIEKSGFALRESLSEFDAEKKFGVRISAETKPTACRCGKVITGRIAPTLCPMFGTLCTPEDPLGPCMVSSEGACAAAYKYQVI